MILLNLFRVRVMTFTNASFVPGSFDNSIFNKEGQVDAKARVLLTLGNLKYERFN